MLGRQLPVQRTIMALRPLKLETGTPAQMGSGTNFPATKLVEIFSADDWEGFTEEYASAIPGYAEPPMRFSGPGDMGRDIVAFASPDQFNGPWDNYQCKRYGEKLTAAAVWVEFGKVIYYSFAGEFKPPRRYYFAASKDIGLSLKKLLTNPARLKEQLEAHWDRYCRRQITETKELLLDGPLKTYFDAFDFSIFKPLSVVEMLKVHGKTAFYIQRFGAALVPARPKAEVPPREIQVAESRYVQRLLEAYADHLKLPVGEVRQLAKWPDLEKHFNRAREMFYHAESLRNFARDSVDEGMFDAVQDEVYHGVVDTNSMDYPDGLARVRSTVTQAGNLHPTCNALCVRVQTQDKQGICHHLANDNRLNWVKTNG
jgi:hypothetical protein